MIRRPFLARRVGVQRHLPICLMPIRSSDLSPGTNLLVGDMFQPLWVTLKPRRDIHIHTIPHIHMGPVCHIHMMDHGTMDMFRQRLNPSCMHTGIKKPKLYAYLPYLCHNGPRIMAPGTWAGGHMLIRPNINLSCPWQASAPGPGLIRSSSNQFSAC